LILQLHISPNSIINAINRLVEKKIVKDIRGVNHRTFGRGSTRARFIMLRGGKGEQYFKNQKPKKIKPYIRSKKPSKYYTAKGVMMAIVQIESGEDEWRVLYHYTKRGYESRIKRSPVLSYIRDELRRRKKSRKKWIIPEDYHDYTPEQLKQLLMSA